MQRQYWLVKQEPEAFAWADFAKDARTPWTGIRNFGARNHLRKMQKGDYVLFYHSGTDRQVVGIAKVERESYADPTAKDGDWSAVDLAPVQALKTPVTLKTIKSDPVFKELPAVRQTRLSVTPMTRKQFERVVQLGETRL